MKNLPRNEFIVRSLTYVRDDNNVILTTVGRKNLLPKTHVILKGIALKNLPPRKYEQSEKPLG